MAIVKMKHVHLVARSDDETALLRELMWLKSVDVAPLTVPMLPPGVADAARADAPGEAGTLWAEASQTLAGALEILSPYATGRRSPFEKPRALIREDFDTFESSHRAVFADAEDVLRLAGEMTAKRAELNKWRAECDALAPWRSVPVDLASETLSRHTVYRLGIMPADLGADFDEAAFGEEHGCVCETVGADAQYRYLFFVAPSDKAAEMVAALEPYRFNRVTFKNKRGTPDENALWCTEQAEQTEARLEKMTERLTRYAEDLDRYENALDMARNITQIYTVREKLLCTGSVFLLDGWCPENKVHKVEKLADKYAAFAEFDDPADDEEPPILLKNNPFAATFEGITEMYALPTYRGIDPNFVMAPFFFLFFGMMFGDFGYGALLTLVTALALWLVPLKEGTKKMVKMFCLCGISAMVWGLLLGSCFGDVIPSLTQAFFKVRVDWTTSLFLFNPMDEPLVFLVVSFAAGFLHILTGLGVKMFMLIRDRHYVEAICDVGFWMILLIGLPVFAVPKLVAGLPPVIGTVGLVMTLVGAAGLVLTQGRDKKNPVMKLLMGLYSLYDITGYLSDILSYSRILALGLSTSVIAMVFNNLATLLASKSDSVGVVEWVFFIIVFVVGTVINIALSLLSTYVHASRLQFIEFFSKFYESGGVAFEPLGVETQYTAVQQQEN